MRKPALRCCLPPGEAVGGEVGQLRIPVGQPEEGRPDRLGLEVLMQELGNVPIELIARLRRSHQAMVTALSRYTSCMEWMSAAPSAIGR